MMNDNSGPSKLERKTIEKNRRILMKGLCFKLASLVPKQHNFHKVSLSHTVCSFQDTASQQDRLDHAAIYINELKERVEELKMKKQSLTDPSSSAVLSLPILEIREMSDTSLEVILVTSLNKNFKFGQVIRIIQEEGGDVVNASYSTVGDKIFHTIHAQVKSSRVGIETSRLFQRLKKLVV